MSEIDERIIRVYDLAERYGRAERDVYYSETGLDADDCFRDLMVYVKSLVSTIDELEVENERLQDAWFRDETICPDGSLRPKVSDLLKRVTELEAENAMLKQLPQPIEFWSDEKKELYRRNESRTIKSGREEERER